jgi:hypothetical protein
MSLTCHRRRILRPACYSRAGPQPGSTPGSPDPSPSTCCTTRGTAPERPRYTQFITSPQTCLQRLQTHRQQLYVVVPLFIASWLQTLYFSSNVFPVLDCSTNITDKKKFVKFLELRLLVHLPFSHRLRFYSLVVSFSVVFFVWGFHMRNEKPIPGRKRKEPESLTERSWF